MPHVRFRAVTEKQVGELSNSLIPPLAKLLQNPEDHFTCEWIQTRFFVQGKEDPAFPFIEVLWFARPADLQQQAATLITDEVRRITGASDVVVIFNELSKSGYYENGKHF